MSPAMSREDTGTQYSESAPTQCHSPSGTSETESGATEDLLVATDHGGLIENSCMWRGSGRLMYYEADALNLIYLSAALGLRVSEQRAMK